jgi:hypothetical protein
MHFSGFALGIANGRLFRKLWSLGSKGVMLDRTTGTGLMMWRMDYVHDAEMNQDCSQNHKSLMQE